MFTMNLHSDQLIVSLQLRLLVCIMASQGSHYLENQGKSGNYELSGMSGNCQGIFLSVRELMGKQVHFYASGLQPCPAH
jgi:hypothetical protein